MNDNPQVNFVVKVSHLICKETSFDTTYYESDGKHDVEPTYAESDYRDQHYTPLELIDKFRRYLEGETVLDEKERKRLIADCKNWKEVEFDWEMVRSNLE